MTEDQAAEKWCPFARAGAVFHGGLFKRIVAAVTMNRGPAVAGECNCIAARCMAWKEFSEAGPFMVPETTVAQRLGNLNVVRASDTEAPYPARPGYVWLFRLKAEGLCGLSEPRVSEVYHA